MTTHHNDEFRQRAAVTDAIDQAEIELFDQGVLIDEDPRDADAVAAFIQEAVRTAPIPSSPALPNIVFDVSNLANEETLAGTCCYSTNTLHLHWLLTDQWTLLALIAHWLTPDSGYGPRYCSVLIELVRASLGAEAADTLTWAFIDHGVSWVDTCPTKS